MRKAITPAMKWDALRRANVHGACYVCKRLCPQDQFQFDHVQALVDGGAHDAQNIMVICVWCHREKSAFEHQRNSKSKRLATARAVHEAVLAGAPKKPGKIKSAGFKGWRKFNGQQVRKEKQS